MQSVCIIGAGNVATQLGYALKTKGYSIIQVYSRTLEHAILLAHQLGTTFTDDVNDIVSNADIYLFSLKDDSLSNVITAIEPNSALWLHTAGSMPIEVFEGKVTRYGVLYPLQTFKKEILVDWQNIPILIEGNTKQTFEDIEHIASSISSNVYPADSEVRKHIHLGAVFVCNFVNYMYTLGADFMQKTNLPFDILLPLIDETSRKVHFSAPSQVQTGPAIRYDLNVIDMQLQMINDERVKQIYLLLTNAIHDRYK